tara:strand:+ start:287 stop:610 length:324 start_codon:yes stop_codon:yes gene_type:complete
MPSEALVRNYHRKNVPKWDAARIRRLCGFLEITEMELAALLLVPEASMKKYISSGKFAGPVKLLLTQIERLFLRGAVNDVAEGKVVPLHLFALQGRSDCPVCGKEMK